MRFSFRQTGLIALAALAASACASRPAIQVSGDDLFASRRSVSISEPTSGLPRDLIVEQLQTTNWSVVNTGADQLLELSTTSGPEQLGVFEGAAAPGPDGVWIIRPAPRRWWRPQRQLRTVTARLVNAATGQEEARATATTTAEPATVSFADLARAALQQKERP
jgi:hypothetical protein